MTEHRAGFRCTSLRIDSSHAAGRTPLACTRAVTAKSYTFSKRAGARFYSITSAHLASRLRDIVTCRRTARVLGIANGHHRLRFQSGPLVCHDVGHPVSADWPKESKMEKNYCHRFVGATKKHFTFCCNDLRHAVDRGSSSSPTSSGIRPDTSANGTARASCGAAAKFATSGPIGPAAGHLMLRNKHSRYSMPSRTNSTSSRISLMHPSRRANKGNQVKTGLNKIARCWDPDRANRPAGRGSPAG